MISDRLWELLCEDARRACSAEPALSDMLHRFVLDRSNLADALAHALSCKLGGSCLGTSTVYALARDCFDSQIVLDATARDVESTWSRNVACKSLIGPALLLKGNVALMAYRTSHALWNAGKRETATVLQALTADCLGMDLHPAAQIAPGVFFDHGEGVVVGETSVIEEGVAIWHGVSLGSTFKEQGDRHPKVRRDSVIAAGAIVLGDVEIGQGALVAAGSVVLEDVPAGVTVAGVPARIVSREASAHLIRPDPNRRFLHG